MHECRSIGFSRAKHVCFFFHFSIFLVFSPSLTLFYTLHYFRTCSFSWNLMICAVLDLEFLIWYSKAKSRRVPSYELNENLGHSELLHKIFPKQILRAHKKIWNIKCEKERNNENKTYSLRDIAESTWSVLPVLYHMVMHGIRLLRVYLKTWPSLYFE